MWEIRSEQVGEENIYIFGQTSDQVIHRYAVGDYDPAQWVEGDANIRRAISFLTGPEMLAAGHAENLTRLHDELIHKDWFQTLPDFNAYVVRKGQALSDYACDPTGWRRNRDHILPDIIVGDFDSVNPDTLEYFHDKEQIEVCMLNPEKDDTDTEYAIREAIRRGAMEIVVIGATGTRIDHVLGNISLLGIGLEEQIKISLVDEHNRIRMINQPLTIRKKRITLIHAG